uniref:Uncharacterized protein n=1 Tax=Arundo donax TaxID=35708 RepID=A0A0A9DUF8_ARUDO
MIGAASISKGVSQLRLSFFKSISLLSFLIAWDAAIFGPSLVQYISLDPGY